MRARYYHTDTGRFLTRHPVGMAHGINLCPYVGNNSASEIDPSGRGCDFWKSFWANVACDTAITLLCLTFAGDAAAVWWIVGGAGCAPSRSILVAATMATSPMTWRATNLQ